MIKHLKSKAAQHKTIIQNFSYLSAIQIFNLFIPLITYPYLIRVLGKETYGLIVFAQAIIGYLFILVSFGFNISATKEVSIHRDDKETLSKIVSSVLQIKVGLLVLTFIILLILLYSIPQANAYKMLFVLTMWICLYDVIFPAWYFQGIERMKFITYLTLISRIIFLGLIFVFIKERSDYLWVPVINGIGALVAGIISLGIIFKNHGLKFIIQPYVVLKAYFVDSIPIFMSNLSVQLYVSTNKVIIGAFLGMADVAYYDLGDKITSILKMPLSLFGQSLFPKINKDKNIAFVKKAFKYSVIFNIFLFVLALFFSRYIVLLLGGNQMIKAIWVVNILALNAPLVAMSNIFGIQLLIPFGYTKKFSQIIIVSGVFYFLQFLIVWSLFGVNIYNISALTVTTEIFVTSLMFYFCKKYKLW